MPSLDDQPRKSMLKTSSVFASVSSCIQMGYATQVSNVEMMGYELMSVGA